MSDDRKFMWIFLITGAGITTSIIFGGCGNAAGSVSSAAVVAVALTVITGFPRRSE